ncbi:hypothetical protein NLX83_25160 [Allokutzneria sp. A3M-2-11 16]|uniref:hypothetical protein n=1 Tax=Allokutzneria sp. A3M-2-11 16 TaxID=2962043 RepID=UPI0020B73767|nr:hypothetical protein [Allokutzneria sp. A3M-2-11 16]MCP3802565.1 hypothetical protein [Allokutzneria sp. A3M-2-11 16]
MEHTSAGDVSAALSSLAEVIDQGTGRANGLRESVEQMQAQLGSAWAGSQRDEVHNALANTHAAVEMVTSGLHRLRHCATLLRMSATQY